VRLLHLFLKNQLQHFEKRVRYIYEKQLEEAQRIVVNKIDCIEAADLKDVKAIMQERYSAKTVLYQNSLDAESVSVWLQALEHKTQPDTLPSLQIDYALYGAGEAQLAWLDMELEIVSQYNHAAAEALALMHAVFKNITAKNLTIGHLKFILNRQLKISYTTIATPGWIDISRFENEKSATVLINARVQTNPYILDALLATAIASIASDTHCKIKVKSASAFTPGFPEPVHRL
jgi:hypothetical protein